MKLQINESQNIEFKQSWRDEYIKWLSAFGNTEGGKLYIGVDDDGEIKGIDNAKKLLEDIPNKVRDILGITVDVNLLQEENKEITASALIHIMKAMTKKTEENAGGN